MWRGEGREFFHDFGVGEALEGGFVGFDGSGVFGGVLAVVDGPWVAEVGEAGDGDVDGSRW